MTDQTPPPDVPDAAPVQGEKSLQRQDGYRPPGQVDWSEHESAWKNYAKRYGDGQSAERIAERGGFGFNELTLYLGHEPKTWRPR